MSVRRLFWGSLFIFTGALLAFAKFGLIQANFSWVYDLWTLVFVFLGATLLKIPKLAKQICAVSAALLISLLITASSQFDLGHGWNCRWNNDNQVVRNESFFNDSVPQKYQYGSLTLSAAAGRFIISEPCDALYELRERRHPFGIQYSSSTSQTINGNEVALSIEPNGTSDSKYNATLKFARNLIWDFSISAGASKCDFNLEDYRVKKIDIESGAASMYLKIGSLMDSVKINAESGASSMVFDIPSSSGCIIKKESALSSFKLVSFIQTDEGTYKSDNYDTAKSKIIIDFSGGVSNFEIKRY